MSDFSNSKVGDKVYHLDFGECGIIQIFKDKIRIEDEQHFQYLVNRYSKIIYHSKPQIIEAKRMVKKEIDVFIYWYGQNNEDILIGFDLDRVDYLCKGKLTFEVEE